MNFGNLNFLESSGPLQACNGTALPFTLCMIMDWHISARVSYTYFSEGTVERASLRGKFLSDSRCGHVLQQ
jgi:hypothetical protein